MLLEWRNVKEGKRTTTICLEKYTWQLVDIFTKGNWHEWAAKLLAIRPDGYTKPYWLRNAVLKECHTHLLERID